MESKSIAAKYFADDGEEPQYDKYGMYMPKSNLNVPSHADFIIPEGLGSSSSIALKKGKTNVGNKLNQNDIEGYLSKYSPSMLKGWQKRYVILRDRKLSYKKTHEQSYPNGVLNFDHF